MTEFRTPPRSVGFFGAALLPVNGMIGAGIFALPAVLVAAVGGFAPWQMLFGGIAILPLILSFAWLSAQFDGSGGPVLYGKSAFGAFAGFQAGWARFAAGSVAIAANTHVMVSYLEALIPALAAPALHDLTVVAVIAALTAISVFGMRQSVRTLGLFTAVKLLPIFALVVSAVVGGYRGQPFALPEFSDVESVLLLSFYAFIGFEGISMPAGEMRSPRRDIPRALVTTLVLVTLIYMAVIWAYGAIAPDTADSRNALAGAAGVSMGQLGSLAIIIAASFSIAANLLAGIVTIPRMAFGMAREEMLPAWFGRLHPRWLTPAHAIITYGVLGMIFSLWGGFAVLAAASTLTRLLTYFVSAAALPVIERRKGVRNRFHDIVTGLALVLTCWIATHADARAWLIFGLLIALGSLLYFLARRAVRGAEISE